jgi:arginine exporter protein ArgO
VNPSGSGYLRRVPSLVGLLKLRALRPRHADTERLTQISATVSISVVLNPHAALHTVGVLGAAIATRAAQERIMFATGAVGPSWVW